ncbi:Aspartic proteinase-like protein 2 [Morus notabilis]|uniref:Aspartic proteinase-like protein 2 n=1 Tax=Morus notabilis TaxID=981085 RepID=W9RGK7_9ROSA|nr:aspartic proteinase-like protein 2 isoform X2 [Morus notabilis]EXB75945.1 Aspartic proteinase-like protein 2 [Morus notabilis]
MRASADFPILALAAAAVALASLSAVVCGAGFLLLERTFPLTHRVELDSLRARDDLRHARILQGGVVDFPVQGSSDPYYVGLYFTKVRLGSPPREFNVQIDTGSDILWVNCNACNDCPQTSGLGIKLNFFDTTSSSTAGLIACSDPICSSSISSSTQCASDSNQCVYTFQYGDGSGTSGHYLTDALYFDMILGQSYIANSSAPIVFGCSTYQSGDLTKTDKAVDGIFGFGQGQLSVISQLSSRGITPRVFSHCLKGDGNGGGILVLGEILEPSIVYTPLVPSQPHYNLDLQSISVNGQILPIDPSAFATSNNRGTIVDSGTTLAYLVEEAYDPFVSAVTNSVSQSVTPMISKGNQCFVVPTSISDIFPPVSLNFAGSASMVLKPEEYLTHQGFVGGAALWCIGFVKVQNGVSILGDLVLKDKIFVYDLAHQRVGWANYDCSTSVNVSVTSSKDFINAGQLSVSSSSREMFFKMLPIGFVALLLLHTAIFSEFQFL